LNFLGAAMFYSGFQITTTVWTVIRNHELCHNSEHQDLATLCHDEYQIIIWAGFSLLLILTLIQSIPLVWQVYQQLRNMMRVKILHKDYQDFKSIYDEQIMVS
jgi:hypothetical protein